MKFGRTIRKLREERNMSIAEFARKVGMSPTYLAPIERDVFPPPAEHKVVRIAKALDQDPDELLALAGRIASDLERIIQKKPRALGALIRGASRMSNDQILKLAGARGKGKTRR